LAPCLSCPPSLGLELPQYRPLPPTRWRTSLNRRSWPHPLSRPANQPTHQSRSGKTDKTFAIIVAPRPHRFPRPASSRDGSDKPSVQYCTVLYSTFRRVGNRQLFMRRGERTTCPAAAICAPSASEVVYLPPEPSASSPFALFQCCNMIFFLRPLRIDLRRLVF